jgi:hypothetical protein
LLLILAVALCLILKAALAETIDGHDGHDGHKDLPSDCRKQLIEKSTKS